MRELSMDLRHAIRSMTRSPGFGLLCVIVLATGIGSSTAVFSLVHTALLRALPFDDPDRVVWMFNQRTERDRAPLSIPDVEDYRREASSLAGLSVFTNWTANLNDVAGPPERLEGTRVSGDFFELLGARALLGRTLQPQDEQSEARVVVVTHGLWIRRFGGDAQVLGRGVSLNGATYTLVGVLPPGFMFPFRDAELAVPISLRSDPRRTDRGANFLRVLARLAPGVTIRQADADLDRIAQRLQRMYPAENARKTGISLYPLHTEIVRDYRSILWMLLASVGVLLAIGCVNLANLLLVRTAERQTEFAVRLSLGASRGRIVRQLLTEAALIAAISGAAGIGLAALGVWAWRTAGPANFPRMAEVGLSVNALMFAIGVSAVTALVCGAVPGWFVAREAEALRSVSRSVTGGRDQARARRAFVAIQIAAATILLVGMALTARGFARLERVSPGFVPDETLSVQLSLPPARYTSREALIQFYDALHNRLMGIPSVEKAGFVSLLPLSGLLSTVDIAFPDRGAPPPDEVPQAHFRVASPEYFPAAGIRVLAGRIFTDHDDADGQRVALVSRTFAERHWPGGQAVGKSVQIAQPPSPWPTFEVVGVVSDVKHFTLDAPSTADLYVPLPQIAASQVSLLAARMFWVVRAQDEPVAVARAMREALLQIDPGIATSSARTLDAVMSSSLAARRVNVRLLQVFGQVAAVLCAIGVYGIAAFSTRTRRRELAIRAALGASQQDLTALMLRTELAPVVSGLGVGMVVAATAAPRIFGAPFEISPRDGSTYAVVAIVLLLLSGLASYLPVRRASTTRPADALRV